MKSVHFLRNWPGDEAIHRAAEISDHFYALVKLLHDKHRKGLQFDSWILLKCFRSRVMAG